MGFIANRLADRQQALDYYNQALPLLLLLLLGDRYGQTLTLQSI
jgi:hypothetical protein